MSVCGQRTCTFKRLAVTSVSIFTNLPVFPNCNTNTLHFILKHSKKQKTKKQKTKTKNKTNKQTNKKTVLIKLSCVVKAD